MLAPLKSRHAVATAEHGETIDAWKKRRAEARAIKDDAKREEALKALGERPAHPTLVAVGCAVVGAVVLWPVTRGHHAVIVASGFTVWLLAALIAGQTAPEEVADGAAQEGDDPAEDESADEVEEPGPTAAEVHALTVRLTAGGTHVLLTRLASDLATAHPGWGASTKAVRALLAGAGIRVRDGVRAGGGNGPGVHHADVPPLSSPTVAAPSAGVVANVGAGQSANSSANNIGDAVGGEGLVWQDDPENPGRSVLVRSAAAA